MKLSITNRALILSAVRPLDTEERRKRYRKGKFPRAKKVKNLDKRYRWDLLHESGYDLTPLYNIGITDKNIDAVLKMVVPPINEPAPLQKD